MRFRIREPHQTWQKYSMAWGGSLMAQKVDYLTAIRLEKHAAVTIVFEPYPTKCNQKADMWRKRMKHIWNTELKILKTKFSLTGFVVTQMIWKVMKQKYLERYFRYFCGLQNAKDDQFPAKCSELIAQLKHKVFRLTFSVLVARKNYMETEGKFLKGPRISFFLSTSRQQKISLKSKYEASACI